MFGITTATPLPAGTVGVPYSQLLAYSGAGLGAVTFSITSGALPAGLTLNSSTGEITGTPTTEENPSFIVRISDGVTACTKTLSLSVAVASDCPDWNTLLWGVPIIGTLGASTAFFAPDSLAADGFSANVVSPGVGDACAAQNTGQLVYGGSGCNCNINIAINRINSNLGGVAVFGSNSGLLLNVNWNTLVTGVYDIPFTLPDTLGVPETISVIVQLQNDNFGTQSNDVNGVITNI